MTQLSLASTTLDKFLDGQVHVIQPKDGYRTGMDAVMLAASVPAQGDDFILDVGSGVGTAMLCLATRVKSCRVIGLEIQPEFFPIAQHNIKLNQLNHRVDIFKGDLKQPLPRLIVGSFSHVMANPPYFRAHSVTESENASQNTANIEMNTPLQDWINFCLRMLKPRGTLTFIFTAERLDELLACLYSKLGHITLFPLWSKQGQPAKRFIVQGTKGHQGGAVLSPGLVIHDDSGALSQGAQAVLRHGHQLKIN